MNLTIVKHKDLKEFYNIIYITHNDKIKDTR